MPPMGAADCRLARGHYCAMGCPAAGCYTVMLGAGRAVCCPAGCAVCLLCTVCAASLLPLDAPALACAVLLCVGGWARGYLSLFMSSSFVSVCCVLLLPALACSSSSSSSRHCVCVLCNTLILAIRSRSLIRYSVSHSFRSALRYRTACCVAYAAYRYCYTQQLLSFTH